MLVSSETCKYGKSRRELQSSFLGTWLLRYWIVESGFQGAMLWQVIWR